MNYFFTGDEHYGHSNIIKYCNRPFKDDKEMNSVIIERHNEVVNKGDIVYHLGDFCLGGNGFALRILDGLKGKHVFLRGSHDHWQRKGEYPDRIELKVYGMSLVLDHYPMASWPRSFHGSWHLHGHSHGRVKPVGKRLDVGVDGHTFYPYSFEQIKSIMIHTRGDNID